MPGTGLEKFHLNYLHLHYILKSNELELIWNSKKRNLLYTIAMLSNYTAINS